ncbi:MAG: terpene cyclase/mutase family protein [Planctomycetaceae bacterium]|nr:terpene cyclase/mutase family protein [Planctomycetaceae bacterium]
MQSQSLLVVLCLLFSLSAARAEEPAGQPANQDDAIRKGLGFVETKSLAWLRERKCASCHHVPLMIWVDREARQRGFKVDEPGLKEATDFMLAAENRGAIIPKPGDPERAGNGYSLMALFTILSFRDVGQGPEPAAQEVMKAAAEHLVSKQQADGSWMPFLGNPPFRNPEEVSTLLAAFGLVAEPRVGIDAAPSATKMREWLKANSKDEGSQARSLRILIDHERKANVELLLQQQNADGGWSQTKEMPSDAFATGQAIYSLISRGGIDKSHSAILKARDFLLKTQKPEGSWPMTSRPFNSGDNKKGSGNLEPITVAGSAWAVLGLLQLTSGTR